MIEILLIIILGACAFGLCVGVLAFAYIVYKNMKEIK